MSEDTVGVWTVAGNPSLAFATCPACKQHVALLPRPIVSGSDADDGLPTNVGLCKCGLTNTVPLVRVWRIVGTKTEYLELVPRGS